ncbi:MAG TPA: ABC transporter ATP-binding protein [Gaiellaceae bacterium]|nr:ABC transporter ATP-binding protein [Gaiellaceae bacterium]
MSEALLELRGVWKEFPGRARSIVACRDVWLTVRAGEVVGLVGESGSGKSTIANLALGLLLPSSGEVLFRGQPVAGSSNGLGKELRAQLQAVFQEPLLALDGRRTIGWSIAEPLVIHRRGSRRERRERVRDLLESVGLDPSLASRRPSELSGGQLQRVNIARALALRPSLLVCDEPVSALDVSVQAQILNLFLEIQRELGIGMLFISHDLAVVRHLSDRLVVMYAGRIVEEGPTEAVCAEPHHPYTQALLKACLEPEPGLLPPASAPSLREGVPSRGCPFVPRCPIAEPECVLHEAGPTETTLGRRSACRRAGALLEGSEEIATWR